MIADFVNALRKWHEARFVIEELARLSDAQLADIGLQRSTFENVVRRGRWAAPR